MDIEWTLVDGKFDIEGIPEGTYNVVVTMVGYARRIVQGVVVQKHDPKAINLTMTPEVIMGDAIVVTAMAVENNEAALLKERQKAPAVSDAISAENIARAGAGDAADAVERLFARGAVDVLGRSQCGQCHTPEVRSRAASPPSRPSHCFFQHAIHYFLLHGFKSKDRTDKVMKVVNR